MHLKFFDTRSPTSGWRRIKKADNVKINRNHFEHYNFDIDGILYFKYEENFLKAYEQHRLWEKLSAKV